MPYNNRMMTYTLHVTASHHDIESPRGDIVVSLSRREIERLIVEGFMLDRLDVQGLNMTLNSRGAIRLGSRLVLAGDTS